MDRDQAVGQIGSWRLDTRKDVLNWSDENHRIFGVPKGTPLSYESFLSAVHPDDREYVNTRWQAGVRGEPYDIEHRIATQSGIEHLYWGVVANRRVAGGLIAQRHVLYLGELNGRQEAFWRKSVELFSEDEETPRQAALFPEEHAPLENADEHLPVVRIRLSQMSRVKPEFVNSS